MGRRSKTDMRLRPMWLRLPPETCLALAQMPSTPGSPPPLGPGLRGPCFRSLLSDRNGRPPLYAGAKRKAIDFVWENFMLVLFIISRRVLESTKAKSMTTMLREARAALWLWARGRSPDEKPSLWVAAGLLSAGLDSCHPLLSIKLLCHLTG